MSRGRHAIISKKNKRGHATHHALNLEKRNEAKDRRNSTSYDDLLDLFLTADTATTVNAPVETQPVIVDNAVTLAPQAAAESAMLAAAPSAGAAMLSNPAYDKYMGGTTGAAKDHGETDDPLTDGVTYAGKVYYIR